MQTEITPQQVVGPGHVPGGQGLAHVTGTDHFTDGADGTDGLDAEADLVTQRAQAFRVPGTPPPQREVVADHQRPHLQMTLQETEEFRRGEGRQFRGEGEHHHAVHPGILQQAAPLRQVRDIRHVLFRGEYRQGVLAEGHHHAFQALFAGGFDDPVDQFPVAQVHPVKDADGNRAIPVRDYLS